MTKDEQQKNAQGCLGCLGFIVIAVVIGMYLQSRHNEAVSEAHKVYDEGKHEEAVARYKTLYADSSSDQKLVMLPRIVKYEVAKGNDQEVRNWVGRGLKDKLDVPDDDPLPREIVAALKKEQADEEARKQREREQAEAERKLARENQAKAAEALRNKRDRYGDLIAAREEAERLVKRLLKFPEEASISWESHIDPAEQESGGRWVLRGEVVGKNAFEVRSRYKWVVKIERREDGKEWWWENIETLLSEDGKLVARSGSGGR